MPERLSNPDPDATELPSLPDTTELLPTRIGPYRPIQVIGEGGMGVVYEAEQREPIRRRVALKLIKHGMDSREVVARFASERQALALMDHPNIAQVFDADATPEGRPYFAMELVHGRRITEFCDTHRLNNAQRVELFLQVCDGVQHAHQKGVLHRDIKPSNILVAHRDGTPVAKIIDFGVAKATVRPLTEKTMFTEVGQLIGTPEYMSPEQADLRSLDIDTRSDVYSLGVLLYELLVGRLPFDDLRRTTFDEVLRRIREEDPPRPSTLVSRPDDRTKAVARKRRTDPAALARQLRGDLDWITMKALEKDRNRRYASASELRADLDRHLHNEPVSAGRPGRGYRVRKFVRRHTGSVAFATTLLVLLIVFGATMAVQRSRISREARTAEHVLAYLADLLEQSSPISASGDPVAIDDVLDDPVLRARPEAQAKLLETLAASYENFDLYADAIRAREIVLILRRRISGEVSSAAMDARYRLARVLHRAGRDSRAGELSAEVLAYRSGVLPPDDPALIDARFLLALTRMGKGDLEGAQRDLEAVLGLRRSSSSASQPDVVESLLALGRVQRIRLDYSAAETSLTEALQLASSLSPQDELLLARALEEVALLRAEVGRFREAEGLMDDSLSILRRKLGERNPRLGATMRRFAGIAVERNRFVPRNFDRSIGLARKAFAIQDEYLGEGHLETARSQLMLAQAWAASQAAFEVSKFSQRALENYRAAFPPDHVDLADALTLRGTALMEQGNAGEAERLLSEAFRIRRIHFPDGHWKRIETAIELSVTRAALGRFDEALALSEAALAARDSEPGPRHQEARVLERVALLQLALGNTERAADFRSRRLELGSLYPVVYADTNVHRNHAVADINYQDDRVERTLVVDAGALARARAATLWIYGRPYNWLGHPFVDREDHLLRVNGDPGREITFDSGRKFHYMSEDFHWAPLEIPLGWLRGGPNTFHLTERSPEGSWDHNNLMIGIDTRVDFDKSWWRADRVKGCYDFAEERGLPDQCKGELMLWLELDVPRDETSVTEAEFAEALDLRLAYEMLRLGAVFLSTGQYDTAESAFQYAQREYLRRKQPREQAIAQGGRGAAILGRGETDRGLALLEESSARLRPIAPAPRRYKFHFNAVVEVYERIDPEQAAAYHTLLATF